MKRQEGFDPKKIRQLLKLQSRLNRRIFRTIPEEVLGRSALDMGSESVDFLSNEKALLLSAVLDHAIFDIHTDGKRVVDRFSRDCSSLLPERERLLLESMRQSVFVVGVIQDSRQGEGVLLRDVFRKNELFLYEPCLTVPPVEAGFVVAVRVFRFEGCWFSSGPPFPFPEEALEGIRRDFGEYLKKGGGDLDAVFRERYPVFCMQWEMMMKNSDPVHVSAGPGLTPGMRRLKEKAEEASSRPVMVVKNPRGTELTPRLLALMEPYQHSVSDKKSFLAYARMAKTAWNLAVMEDGGKDRSGVKSIRESAGAGKRMVNGIIASMMERKRDLFPDDRRWINEIHVRKNGDTLYLTASTMIRE